MSDVELDSWRAQWQTVAPPLPDLRERVERETRIMRRIVIGQLAVTVVFGGATVAWAALSRRSDAIALAVGVCVFIAIAWTIAFLLRRDAWSPATLSAAACLDLSILRCGRRRAAVAAQSVLYALILGFDLAWIYYFAREPGSRDVLSFLTSGGVVWIWPVSAILAVAAWRRRLRLSREVETLIRLRADLDFDSILGAAAESSPPPAMP
jgi:hypothetical protein